MSEQQSAATVRPPVGVWIWLSFDDPIGIVRRAREIGFDFLQIMVNHEPSRSEPDKLQAVPTSEIVALAKAAHDTSTGHHLDRTG